MIRPFLAIGLLVALAAVGDARAAAVNISVSRDEILPDAQSVDTFEITCKGSAAFLCVQSIDRGTPDDPMIVSLVGTAPAIMLGASDVIEAEAGTTDAVCLSRRNAASTMKALATFKARHDAGFPATYTLVASCVDDIGKSLPIKVKSKQQESQT